MPEQQPTQSSNSQGSKSSDYKPPTRYGVVKEGWGGSRPNFQGSYGLGMDPESIEEGNAILDGFIKHDRTINNRDTNKK
ncbi:hypothetical protein FSARC_446 [Fusarium sarcochroum]|uniref:Uncharacterized protein n=1 Tax=Fusarium sarcochroum TaxID=1208366 RepID=A0A8H4UBS1_9HYPO|nr:hypothetical protein FSARC_446 [Fusarium sarcochroum]